MDDRINFTPINKRFQCHQILTFSTNDILFNYIRYFNKFSNVWKVSIMETMCSKLPPQPAWSYEDLMYVPEPYTPEMIKYCRKNPTICPIYITLYGLGFRRWKLSIMETMRKKYLRHIEEETDEAKEQKNRSKP